MKKIFLALVFLMIAASAFAAVDTRYFGKSPNILVSMSKQDPDPVEPGQEFEASFKLDNNGTSTDNFIFEVLPEYPLSMISDASSNVYIGSLSSSQYGRQSVIVKFKMKVAQDASDGDRTFKVRYKNDNSDTWTTVEGFSINVQSKNAVLAVDKVSASPEVTAPGSRTTLKIYLKNYASSVLKYVKVSLNLNSADSSQKIPFSPIGSANEQVIQYIDPQATVPVSFNLLVDSDAASKSYKVPMTLQ